MVDIYSEKQNFFWFIFVLILKLIKKTQGKTEGFLPNSLKMKEKRTIRSN